MSQSDLDQGGTVRQLERVYLGPSIGWQYVSNNTILSVTAGGTTTVLIGTTLVRVNSLSAVTIQLPSAAGAGAGAGAVPGTFLGRSIAVVDEGGNAGSAAITILPYGAETIDGLASIEIGHAYGAFVLTPNTPDGGWTLTQ